jgi:arylesterase/paraoxonase
MRRARIALFLALALALSALGWLLFPAPRGDAACRAVALRNAGTGAAIQGTEDLALDAGAGRLIVSAYDRRANAPGGLYAVALSELAAADGAPVAARPLRVRARAALKPHGIALAPDGARLYAINRLNGAGRAAELLALRLEGLDAVLEWQAPLPCGANDVLALGDGTVLATVDRAACQGPRRLVDDALNRATGSVIALAQGRAARTRARGLAFANGIAEAQGRVYVAATRARALYVYDKTQMLADGAEAAPLMRIALAGAPDNLSRGADGSLYIAAHRNVLRFALYRAGLSRRAPGEIWALDPSATTDAGRLVLLARNLDGPTSAVAAAGLVIAGAGYGAGLAVCTLAREGAP